MRILALTLISFIFGNFSCTTKSNQPPSENQSQKISSHSSDSIKIPTPVTNASDYVISNKFYTEWQADTVARGSEDFALITYNREDSIDLKNLLGEWLHLEFDTLRRNHVRYQPCEAGIQEYSFRNESDSSSEKKLQMTWFSGQMADLYNITITSNNGSIQLSGANLLEINFNYAFNWWRVGGLWHYPNTAIFTIKDGWGKTKHELFVKKSESELFEVIEEQPCDH
jgi:hypothetical protein